MNPLFAWLWQGAAIALATAALLAVMRRLNAATRHAIWWCAMAAVLAAPFLRAATSAAAAVESNAVAAAPSRALVVPAPPDWIIAALIGAWLGSVLIGGVRIAAGLRLMARLKSESRPLDGGRESRLPMWQSLRGRCRPELRVSRGARAACALGLRYPVIILSEVLVDALDDEALDQVVLHEYAHLLRHDDWLRLIESAIVSLAGFHPAVRFIARQIDLEREAACDDAVVSRTGGVRAYAACLADAAAIASRAPYDLERQLVPGATGATVSLRARVVRLLDPRRGRGARLAPLAIGIGLLTAVSVSALSHRAVPVLIVDTSFAPVAPAVQRASIAQASPAAAAAFEAAALRATAPPTFEDDRRSDVQRPVSQRVRTRTSSSAQVAPSEAAGMSPGAVPDAAPAPLASSNLTAAVHAPVAIAGGAMPGTGARAREAGVRWSSLGAPGVAIGRGARSLAGFFGGAAKAVATSF